MERDADPTLARVLTSSQTLGYLGPGDPWDHVGHSLAFADAFRTSTDTDPANALDLGSGGGVPGLVLARLTWPSTEWVLLDGSTKRVDFLSEAIDEMKLSGRVVALAERAEVTGRDSARRGAFDLVVSRSFGPPAVVAECAAPLLRVGGCLIVSEPPGGRAADRWPSVAVSNFGLVVTAVRVGPPSLVVLHQVEPCDERWPRRVGIPAKRPAF